jgi:hypothetical protein
MRHMGDESVESVEKGDRPDVEHIYFQVSGEAGSSLMQPDEREAS